MLAARKAKEAVLDAWRKTDEGKADAKAGDREHVVEGSRSGDHGRHALCGAIPTLTLVERF